MENNNFDDANKKLSPEEQALTNMDKATRESKNTPEEWLKKIDASEKTFLDKDENNKDKRSDYISLYFRKINPLDIPIADLKDNLNKEIQKLREDIEDIKINTSMSPDAKERYIAVNAELIAEKQKWMHHIDDFIMKGDSEPFDDSQLDAEHKKEKIHKLLDKQNNWEQN